MYNVNKGICILRVKFVLKFKGTHQLTIETKVNCTFIRENDQKIYLVIAKGAHTSKSVKRSTFFYHKRVSKMFFVKEVGSKRSTF